MKDNSYNKDTEQKHFDLLAKAEGEIWWGSATEAGIKRLERRAFLVKNALSELPDPKVLEIGCGTGAFSKHILNAVPELHLTACDISPECVKKASERYSSYSKAKFILGDATYNLCDPSSFDAVIGNAVLHHLPLNNSLMECFKALKPGGRILFFEPNMMNPQIFIEKNIKFIGKALQNTETETAFLRWRLKKDLSQIGFVRISVKPFDFLHPLIPGYGISLFDALGKILERIPILREFSGSLIISAFKPR